MESSHFGHAQTVVAHIVKTKFKKQRANQPVANQPVANPICTKEYAFHNRAYHSIPLGQPLSVLDFTTVSLSIIQEALSSNKAK